MAKRDAGPRGAARSANVAFAARGGGKGSACALGDCGRVPSKCISRHFAGAKDTRTSSAPPPAPQMPPGARAAASSRKMPTADDSYARSTNHSPAGSARQPPGARASATSTAISEWLRAAGVRT